MIIRTPAARLAGLSAYRPPVRGPGIDLLLDLNEGEPPASVLERWGEAFDTRSLCRYPDATALEAQIAESIGIDPRCVVVTNGGDDAIDRVCRATLEPGRTLLTHTPSFEMTTRSARLAGASVRELEWWQGPFPRSEFERALDPSVSLVAITTPNNPTGATIGTDDLLAIVQQCRCAVLVDLAYAEFAGDDATTRLADERNAIVIRTFSKAFGLASARVGYAIAAPEVADWLRIAGGPFPASGASLALASMAWSQREQILGEVVPLVREGRERIATAIARAGGVVLPSQANFIMARFDDAEAVARSFADQGIAIRCFAKPHLASWVRITIPARRDAQDRVLAVLSEIAR